MNPPCVHPLVFIPRWTREDGPRAIERGASCGFDVMIVRGRHPDELDASDIAPRASAAGLRLICSTYHSPGRRSASDDPAIAVRGAARLMDAVRLAPDLGAIHLRGVRHAAF
ncbi:hypothetical protein [Falsiroseomonas sp. HW251]|uniref:hypothetical protein n=1 Tax=Falsiroseomonas sp. HW251 TaxID=3390998 RepID=UPI003D3215D5